MKNPENQRPETTQSPTTTAIDAAAAKTALPKNRTDVSRETSASNHGDQRIIGKTCPSPFKRARAVAFAAVIALVALGLAFRTGTGTPSSFGLDAVAALCPLGALETMLGAREIMLHPLLLLAAMVVVVMLVGKAFCAWMCPAPWLQRLIKPSKRKAPVEPTEPGVTEALNPPSAGETAGPLSGTGTNTPAERLTTATAAHSCTRANGGHCSTCALDPVGGARDGIRFDTRHATLLGALGATAVFGFPVFCLVCPIGLTFATFIGLWHLFQFNETTWGLIIFPVILVMEVAFLRKWCAKICPVSALVSLIASANRILRPRVRREACLRTSGIDCRVCVEACPEQVDPHSPRIPECSKCGACIEACPAHAIDLKLLPERK